MIRILLCILPLVLHFALLAQKPVAHPQLDSLVKATGFEGIVLVGHPLDNKILGGHVAWADVGFLPASTFKIYNSLIALDAGVLPMQGHVFKWDGQPRMFKQWEEDLSLEEAFKRSCVPCYREVARMVGETKMREGLARLGYGNQDMSAGLDLFWLEGGMQITPMAQLRLLYLLAAAKLPFSLAAQAKVADLMVLDRRDGKVLHGKTGWADDGELSTGWFVGWLETPSGNFPFVSLLQGRNVDDSFKPGRRLLAENALGLLGLW